MSEVREPIGPARDSTRFGPSVETGQVMKSPVRSPSVVPTKPTRSTLALVAILGAIVVALFGLGGFAAPATAAPPDCTCQPSTTEQDIADADVVFSGIVQSQAGASGDLVYDVTVRRVYQGAVVAAKVEVRSAGTTSACGLGGIPSGSRYMFFAREAADGLRAGLCSGTAPASTELTSKVTALLGNGSPPPDPAPPADPVFTLVSDGGEPNILRMAAPGAALALVCALLLLVVGRRGRPRGH